MTQDQVAGLGPALTQFLGGFRKCFPRRPTFGHLGTYCRGLLSDLGRKSVEPIALSSGTAVRTLQEFLTHHAWDQDALLQQCQRRIVTAHLPAPGEKGADSGSFACRDLGVIGIVDETSAPKKGNKTPGVQRQYCGALGCRGARQNQPARGASKPANVLTHRIPHLFHSLQLFLELLVSGQAV